MSTSARPSGDLRTDGLTGTRTYVVDSRQDRPNLPPWRAPHVTRYVAAGELGSGVYFNPVAPAAAAQALRDAG